VVPAEAVAGYAAAITEAEDLTARGLDRSELAAAPLATPGVGTWLVALGAGVGLVLVIFLAIRLLGGSSRIQPAPAAAVPAGGLAAAAPAWTPGPPPAPTELTLPAQAFHTNSWAIASMWLGISCLILLPWSGHVLLGLLATVFGALGLFRASKLGGTGFGRSLAGVIMGTVAMPLNRLLQLFVDL